MMFHEVVNKYTHQSPSRPGSFNRIALGAVFFLAMLMPCQQVLADTDSRVAQQAIRAQVNSLFDATIASANSNKCESAGRYVTTITALLEKGKFDISIFKDRHTEVEQQIQSRMMAILGSIQACERRISTAARTAPPVSLEPTGSSPQTTLAVIAEFGFPYSASPQDIYNKPPLGQFAYNMHLCVKREMATWNGLKFLQFILPSGEAVYSEDHFARGITRDPAGDKKCELMAQQGDTLTKLGPPRTGEPIPRTEAGRDAATMHAGANATVPILQLETGMHTGGIDAMSVDGTGRLLLTASAADKTARLWSLPDGHLLTILRPPQNLGLEGSLAAAALSADGAVAAVGGDTGADWDGSYSIYIFDTRTGRMTGRLPTGANRPSELVFSPDGRFLVAGLFQGGGIRAWQTDGWTKAGEDANYGSTVRNISFDHSGRFVTSGDEGVVRLYDSSFRLIASAKIEALNVRSSLSPDGTQVAVTPGLHGELVDILSGHDLRQLFSPDTRGRKVVSNDITRAMEAAHNGASPGVDAVFDSTTWSIDGRTLYAVGTTFGDKQERFVSSWSGGGARCTP